MAVSIATEEALARDIAEQLTTAFGAANVSTGFNASGYPTITYGSLNAGQGGAYIQVVPSDDVSGTDSLGLTQRVYHPHLVQACLEESATTNVFVMISTTFARVANILDNVGTKIEFFKSANTVTPGAGSITGTPLLTLWPDIYNKMKQSQ